MYASTRTAPVSVRPLALILALATAIAAALTAVPAEPRLYLLDAAVDVPEGARLHSSLPFIDAVVVASDRDISGAAALDTPARPESLIISEVTGSHIDSGVASTGAPAVWSTTTGEQAVVALIDTGVADVPALDGAIAGEIDFTGTGGGDGFGHGTFLASIIAGRRSDSPGVAPGTGVLSLKVADAEGNSTLGSLIDALQWLHGPGRQAGIRIVSLAMAVEPGTEGADFLERAVDRVAQSGILVVTAAGNDGPDALTSPATSSRTFSVGSVDDQGTADRGDDTIATFSGSGLDVRGVVQPDVVASGVDVVGSLPPGSVLASGATVTPEGLYEGSGTSMSTALTAGVAALASSVRTDLHGDALAAALHAGGGDLDAEATLAAALDANPSPGNSNGNGGRNGNANANANGGGSGDQSVDAQSVRWTSVRWTSVRWTGAGWGDETWSMAAWGGVRWTGVRWTSTEAESQGVRWTGVRWTGVRWTGVRWTAVS